jgi:hypothetical protein
MCALKAQCDVYVSRLSALCCCYKLPTRVGLSSGVCCFLSTFRAVVIYVVPNNRDGTLKNAQNKMCNVCLYIEGLVMLQYLDLCAFGK